MTATYNDATYSDMSRARTTQSGSGCGTALIAGTLGLLVGVLLMVGYLLLYAPAPRQAIPATSGSSAPVTITLDDTYVSQLVAAALTKTQPSLDVSNVQTQINPGNELLISGDVNTLGAARPFTATADVLVNNGSLAIHISSVQLVGLPVPDALTSALESSINTQLRQTSASFLPPHSGYAIKSVSTVAHRMTIFIGKP